MSVNAHVSMLSHMPFLLVQSRGSHIPIALDFFPSDNDQQNMIQQQVTFEGCIFEDIEKENLTAMEDKSRMPS